jgi:hypothetical protein
MIASKPLVSSLRREHSYLVHRPALKHIGASSHEWTEVGSTRVTKLYLEIASEEDPDIYLEIWWSKKSDKISLSLSLRLGIA